MRNSRRMMACLIGSCMGANETQAGSDVLGIWIDHTGRGGVELKECGSNLCGHLVWLKEGTDKRGCGLQIIGKARSVARTCETVAGYWIPRTTKSTVSNSSCWALTDCVWSATWVGHRAIS